MTFIPTPRYLFRKALISKILKDISKKHFLEIGVGAGDFITFIGNKGFHGVGVDISEEAVEIARNRVKKARLEKMVKIEQKSIFDISGIYDVVFAFEVLEHIDEDEKFINVIKRFLNREGVFIFSVPARMKMWGASDEWVGHVRRYEKEEIISKLERNGFEVKVLWSYGFPFINLIKPSRDYLAFRRYRKETQISKEERIKKSGLGGNFPKMFKILFNDFTLCFWYKVQEFFLNKDLGDGYLIKAIKRENAW